MSEDDHYSLFQFFITEPNYVQLATIRKQYKLDWFLNLTDEIQKLNILQFNKREIYDAIVSKESKCDNNFPFILDLKNFVAGDTVQFFITSNKNIYEEGLSEARFILCSRTNGQYTQLLANLHLSFPQFIFTAKMKYILVYDINKSEMKTAYTLYSVNVQSEKHDFKIKLKGSIVNKKIQKHKFDLHTGHLLVDRKQLNDTQSLLFDHATGKLYVFDHSIGKLKKIFTFNKSTIFHLSKLGPFNPYNYFQISEERVVSSERHKIIILRNDHYGSREFILLKFENGKFVQKNIKQSSEINRLFSTGKPIKIDI